MKNDPQSTTSNRLTIFKPPTDIYKLSKVVIQNQPKPQYDIYQNNQSCLRKYSCKIFINNQTQLLTYEWRKNSTLPIVNILYLELLNKTLSHGHAENGLIPVNIYTEHIEKSLADLSNLPIGYAIYILKSCILAYQQIFSKFSTVSINKYFIGLNTQGELKVWINNNLALNSNLHPSKQSQYTSNDLLTSETSIVRKIICLVSLLVNPSSKHFFYGLEKELTIKRFSFKNCLLYINSFISNTKNLQIPSNLVCMLSKKNCFGFDRSLAKIARKSEGIKNADQTKNLCLPRLANAVSSFKSFGSKAKIDRLSVSKQISQSPKVTPFNQSKFQFQGYSEQVPNRIKKFVHSKDEKLGLLIPRQSSKRYKEILHPTKNKKRNSTKDRNLSTIYSPNVCSQKSRPSFQAIPSFILKSIKGDETSNNRKQKTQGHHQNLINKNTWNGAFRQFENKNGETDFLRQTYKPSNLENIEPRAYRRLKNEPWLNFRVRCQSEAVKFGSQYITDKALASCKHFPCRKSIQKIIKSHSIISEKSKNKTRNLSKNSISNEGATKKRSFITRTNQDSNTDDNQKTQSFSRMDFSSMSIQNKFTNKNFDTQLPNFKKQQMKRSLMSFKFGFEQILQNSFHQIEEQNQSKSFNGNSPRKTQNLEELPKIQKKNEELSPRKISFFAQKSNKRLLEKINDQVYENLDKIREKNEQFLVKNKWKKTINDLNSLETAAVNQSILDQTYQIQQKGNCADVILEKLDRLGKNMCFSILNKNQQHSGNTSLKTLNSK